MSITIMEIILIIETNINSFGQIESPNTLFNTARTTNQYNINFNTLCQLIIL